MFVQVISAVFLYLILNQVRKNIDHIPIIKKHDSICKIFSNWGGQDRAFKIIQNALIFISGCMDSSEMYIIDHARMIIISKTYRLDNISNFFAFLRKITRFPRTRYMMMDTETQYNKIKDKRYKIDQRFQQIFKLFGQLFDLMYFLSDHYMALCLMSIFTDFSMLDLLEYYFSAIWFLSSFFFLLRNVAILIRVAKIKIQNAKYKKNLQQQNKQQEISQMSKKQKQDFKKYLLIDISKNIIDLITNYAAMYPAHFAKASVGLLGMSEGILWIVNYLRIYYIPRR